MEPSVAIYKDLDIKEMMSSSPYFAAAINSRLRPHKRTLMGLQGRWILGRKI